MYSSLNPDFMFQHASDRVAELRGVRSAESTGGLGGRWWHRSRRTQARHTRVPTSHRGAHLARFVSTKKPPAFAEGWRFE